MIGHQYIGIYDQSFFFLTINQTINNNILILGSGKNINPTNYGITNKINSFRISELVFPAHFFDGKNETLEILFQSSNEMILTLGASL